MSDYGRDVNYHNQGRFQTAVDLATWEQHRLLDNRCDEMWLCHREAGALALAGLHAYVLDWETCHYYRVLPSGAFAEHAGGVLFEKQCERRTS